MGATVFRVLRLLAVPAAVITIASTSSAGAADPAVPFDWTVDASTHLRKPDRTVTIPTGKFTGRVNPTTGELTGHLALPRASTTIVLAGVGPARATFRISEVQPVTGHVDLTTLQATATAVFDIAVAKVSPALLPLQNLVGTSCRTSTPVTVTMSGIASLTEASTFTGTYTIAKLADCGALTPALNLVVPGPGNTFTAVAAPR